MDFNSIVGLYINLACLHDAGRLAIELSSIEPVQPLTVNFDLNQPYQHHNAFRPRVRLLVYQ